MKKILFIHHSTGANLIREGHLRDEIEKLGPRIEFWDHGYNLYQTFPKLLANFTHHTGLKDNNGVVTGKDYDIVLSNNGPREYAEIFSRDINEKTLKSILSYDVIAFKNCYPTTKITSDEQLEEDKKYYQIIRDNLKKHSQKQFVLLTPPPIRKSLTNSENAQRAQKLVHWLNSPDFLQGVSNIHVFDFFGLLVDEHGFLKKEFERLITLDSHPNKKANVTVGPIFAKKLVEVANKV